MAMRNDSPHYRRKIKYLVKAVLELFPNQWVTKAYIASVTGMHVREVAWALQLLRETTGMTLNGQPCNVVWSSKGSMITTQLAPVMESLQVQDAHLHTRHVSRVLTGPDVIQAWVSLPDDVKREHAKEFIKLLAPYL